MTRVDTGRVLVRPGWPAGFCPVHFFDPEQRRCNLGCQPQRIEIAKLDAELRRITGKPVKA